MRKKFSEMTPVERADKLMKGLTWEEAEEVGVEILARCFALHIYARKDGSDWYPQMNKKLFDRTEEWKNDNSWLLAMAATGQALKTGELKLNTLDSYDAQ